MVRVKLLGLELVSGDRVRSLRMELVSGVTVWG